MKHYCVIYIVCGTHYRFRCMAKNKRDARRKCREIMSADNIVDVEEEKW